MFFQEFLRLVEQRSVRSEVVVATFFLPVDEVDERSLVGLRDHAVVIVDDSVHEKQRRADGHRALGHLIRFYEFIVLHNSIFISYSVK